MKKSTVVAIVISLCVIALVLMFLPIALLNMDAAQIGAFILMPIFLLLTMGIAYLLSKKSRNSMGELIKKNTILSWQMENNDGARKKAISGIIIKNVAVILVCVLALGTILLVNGADITIVLCFLGAMLALCSAFALGGAVQGLEMCGGLNGFILGHNFLCLSGKFILLDGMKNAVYKAELNEQTLTLGLILGGKNTELPLEVPAQSLASVQSFIDDLKEHFSNADQEPTVTPASDSEA